MTREEIVQALREQFPDAGAVGPRLVFADGRLQEAGGIVWQDASAWNYGRFMKPEAPRYSYARRVDYCSAACLMVRAELLRELEGFDEAFAPGYYEDTDLCFRLRKAGKAVYYQPGVTVAHYEGATAGRRQTAGMKQHQDRNRDIFYKRWRETLSTLGQPTRRLPQPTSWTSIPIRATAT